MTGIVSWGMIDHDGETSSVRLNVADFDAENFEDQMALVADLWDALDPVTRLNRISLNVGNTQRYPRQLPANKDAQRESKWLVRYYDTVTYDAGSIEIPGAELNLLDANTGRMDPENPAYADLVTALEAIALSSKGNPISVVEIIHVSRNL